MNTEASGLYSTAMGSTVQQQVVIIQQLWVTKTEASGTAMVSTAMGNRTEASGFFNCYGISVQLPNRRIFKIMQLEYTMKPKKPLILNTFSYQNTAFVIGNGLSSEGGFGTDESSFKRL